MFSTIRKRNGDVVAFQPEKITRAIFKAANAVGPVHAPCDLSGRKQAGYTGRGIGGDPNPAIGRVSEHPNLDRVFHS